MRVKKESAVIGEIPTTIIINICSKNISICYAMPRMQVLHKKYLTMSLIKIYFMTELHQKCNHQNLNGYYFIMDNVAFHKCTTIKQLIIASSHTVNN